MQSFRHRCWLLVCLILFPLMGYAHLPDSLSNEAEVSLLVATPSDAEVYTLYGHVALRIQDPNQELDVAFNYGIFDFDDDFLWRFVKGQTDYIVQAIPTEWYLNEYLQRGSEVRELHLESNKAIRQRIWSHLLWNIQPQHRTYRYNFFYDNCATRPIEIYTEAIKADSEEPDKPHPIGEGFAPWSKKHLQIPNHLTQYTWRDVINTLEASHPWLVFGTDLALGAETDRIMSFDQQIFAPHLLEQVLSKSYIEEKYFEGCVMDIPIDTLHIPILTRTANYKSFTSKDQNEPNKYLSKLLSPLSICLVIWSISFGWLIQAYRRGIYPIAWHYALLITAGILGLFIFYIAVLSEHPHRSPNFNLIVLHPLHLLLAVPLMAIRKLRRGAYLYHFANFAVQCVFLASAYFLPQTFNSGVIFLSLALGSLSLAYIYRYRALERTTIRD